MPLFDKKTSKNKEDKKEIDSTFVWKRYERGRDYVQLNDAPVLVGRSTIGNTIKEQYSRYGKCFRYGGDEFCVLLMKNRDNVEQINTSFFGAMAKLREEEARMPAVSIGYACFDPKNQSMQDVVEEADQMMYKFKEAHRTKLNDAPVLVGRSTR